MIYTQEGENKKYFNIKKRSGEIRSKEQNKRVLSSKSFQEMKVKRRQEFADKTKAGESR
jgi:hypothetical protein